MTDLHHNIVFFDGFCGLCSEFVDFILKIDKNNQFKFSPLQSPFAQKQLPANFVTDLSTVVIMIDGQLFTKAQAVLRLFKKIGGWWFLLSLFRILPDPLLNFFYDLIARYRYLIRPPKENCRLPTAAEKERFII